MNDLRLAEQGSGGFPIKAGIGDRDAVEELGGISAEGLSSVFDVTLQHGSDDVAAACGPLFQNALPDFGLPGGIFAAIGMTAVDHDGGRDFGSLEFRRRIGCLVRVIIDAVTTTTQDKVYIGVALRLDDTCETLLVNAQKTVPVA